MPDAITGGLGGIGLSCACWLAQRRRRSSLVLLSRTGLPPRSDEDYRASGTVGTA